MTNCTTAEESEPQLQRSVSCHSLTDSSQLDSLRSRSCQPESSDSGPCTDDQDDCSVAHETTVLVRSEKDDVVAASKDGTLQQRRRPERPPRIKDTAPDSSSKEYYNLVNPAPEPDTLPSLPRRKPFIASPDSPTTSRIALKSGTLGRRGKEKAATLGKEFGTLAREPGTLSRDTGTLDAKSLHTSSRSTTMGRPRCGSRSSAVSSINSRTMQYRKKNLTRQRRKGSTCHCREKEREDEVVLLYSKHCQGSSEWARYLFKVFTELSKNKRKLSVRHLPVEDVAPVLPPHLESEIYSARLQLVILSPTFLNHIQREPSQLVGRLLQQDRVIAVLLGVREEQVTQEHRSSLVSFPQWVHLEARDSDLEFVQTVLYFSTQILQRTEQKEAAAAETFFFSVFPRKVTESQPRLVIILDHPVNTRSTLRVYAQRAGERIAVEEVKLKNPYTVNVTLPTCLMAKSCLVSLYLEVDGEPKGFRQVKCEAKQHELEILLSSLLDPIEFLCQSVSLTSQCKDQLDEKLTQSFLANIPKHGLPLLSTNNDDMSSASNRKELSEYPTLLHFSAAHGLEQLTCALLDCPGAQAALNIRNLNDLTPADLAKEFGHHDLAEILATHSAQPSQFSHIYDYIKHAHFYKPTVYATTNQHQRAPLLYGAAGAAVGGNDANRDTPNEHGSDQRRVNPSAVLHHHHNQHLPAPSNSTATDHPAGGGGRREAASGSVASDFANSDYSGPDPAYSSAYKVPPPPRPLPSSPPAGKPPGNYLDMTGSHSNTPSPAQKRRLEPEYLRRRSNLRDITHLLHSLEMHMERNSRRALGADDSDPGAPPRHLWSHIETRESVLDNHRHHQVATTGRVPQVAATSSSVDPHNLHNHHDATYQEIPELMDGFNRFGPDQRTNQARRSLREKPRIEPEYTNFNRDPFGTMRAARGGAGIPPRNERGSSIPSSINDDVFTDSEGGGNDAGTLLPSGAADAPVGGGDDVGDPVGRGGSRAPALVREDEVDYRGVEAAEEDVHLAATEELLGLLEDFKQKSYTIKEMEILFENWRRKVEIPPVNPPPSSAESSREQKCAKPSSKTHSLFRMLKSNKESCNSNNNNTNIKPTNEAKKFTKDGSGCMGSSGGAINATASGGGDQLCLNESEMSVVCLPATPAKPNPSGGVTGGGGESLHGSGVSSQILPLHRFNSDTSLSRQQALPPPVYKEPPRPKPVAEVSPFSTKKKGDGTSPPESIRPKPTSTILPSATMSSSSTALPPSSDSVLLTPPAIARTKSSTTMLTSVAARSSGSSGEPKRTSTPDLGRGVRRQMGGGSGGTQPAPTSMPHPLSPIRQKLLRFRRSVTEPLFQYFHEMHMASPDFEEPDILSTPKTLLPAAKAEDTEKRLSRRLFGGHAAAVTGSGISDSSSGGDNSITGAFPSVTADSVTRSSNAGTEKKPKSLVGGGQNANKRITGLKPAAAKVGSENKVTAGKKTSEGDVEVKDENWSRHPAPTSQVNEYENISPTPSTDL